MMIKEQPNFHPHNLSITLNSNTSDLDYPPSPIDLDSLCEHFNNASFDSFTSDHFRIFEFKIRKCARSRSHDWTDCPYAHPGEKARRRDPRRFNYSGTSCPNFRKGDCDKGDTCEFAHGVFECWLHPSRYRTQLCKDGTNCRRRVCFFAHTQEQLRFFGNASAEFLDGSPGCNVSSPTSVLQGSPRNSFSVFGSVGSGRGSKLGPGFLSLSSPPSGRAPKFGDESYEEEPVMERVESGREIRAIMYAKLCKENSFG